MTGASDYKTYPNTTCSAQGPPVKWKTLNPTMIFPLFVTAAEVTVWFIVGGIESNGARAAVTRSTSCSVKDIFALNRVKFSIAGGVLMCGLGRGLEC